MIPQSILLASWWEPGTPNVLDVGDVSALLGLLVLAGGTLVGITRWWLKLMRKMMKEEIAVATAPIHPNANGGLSLPDVARKTDKLESHLCSLEDKVTKIADQNQETKDLLIKVLAQSVIIPDTPPVEAKPRTRSKKTN